MYGDGSADAATAVRLAAAQRERGDIAPRPQGRMQFRLIGSQGVVESVEQGCLSFANERRMPPGKPRARPDLPSAKEVGLPDAILCDNAFAVRQAMPGTLTRFEANLIRLNIEPIHGRPYHPVRSGWKA